jgi:hypothetical protein
MKGENMSEFFCSSNPCLDFSFQGFYDSFSPFDDEFDCLEKFENLLLEFKRISKLRVAYAIYLCEKKELYLQAYPDSKFGKIYLRGMYLNDRIPELLSLDRRTISDYRIVGKFIEENMETLLLYDKNFFEQNLLKNFLMAAIAVKRGFDVMEVILNLFTLKKENFALFVKGKEFNLSAQPKSKIERYIDVYERQRVFFGF